MRKNNVDAKHERENERDVPSSSLGGGGGGLGGGGSMMKKQKHYDAATKTTTTKMMSNAPFSTLPYYKHLPPLHNQDEWEKEWEQLRAAIQCVFENATKHLSFEELSNVVYRMVLSGSSTTRFMREKLKEELRKRAWMIKEELKRMERTTFRSSGGEGDYGGGYEEEEEEKSALAFLEAMIRKWSEFEQQVEVIRDVFMHMERKKLDDGDAANGSAGSYAGRGAPATTPAQRRENEKKKKKLGVRSLGREIFSQNMFGIPSKIDLDDEKYALEARKSTITAHLQACVKMLLDRERREMQRRIMEYEKTEEAENAPVSLIADDENDDEIIVDDDVERREAMVAASAAAARAAKSNENEESASTKRRSVIKRTAEMFWTLSARASECGYEDIYENIIASESVLQADEVYTTYTLSIAESARDCSQYLRRCKTLLRHEKYLVADTMASKSDTAKRIIRTIQTAMFGIKSQAREHAFVRGFFALMINDDMNTNPQDDLDLRSHEELVVVDGVTTTAMIPQTTSTNNNNNNASTRVLNLSDEVRYADVRLAYDLFAKLTNEDGLDTLRSALYVRVEELGNAIVVANEKNPIEFVRATILLKNKTDMVIKKGFRGDKTFTNRAYAAFEHFLNENKRSSEFLSLYLDHYLRGNLSVEDMEVEEDQKKTTTTQQIWKEAGKATIVTTSDAAIDACIAIFRFLREKDTFEMYYQLHLSKRLLASKSVSDDHSERDVVSKLKLECGYQYAQKVEVMLNDASLSKAITRKFNELVEHSQRGGDYNTRSRLITTDYIGKDTGNVHPDVILGGRKMMSDERFFEVTRKTELGVKVLTTGSWPLTKLSKLKFPKNLPRTCQDMQKLFVNHYEANYGARRIAWRPDCGTAELRVQFNSGEKLLIVSTMQMCILEIFNDHEAVSLRQISKILDVEYDACIKALHSMVFSKEKNVLLRNKKTSMSQTNNNNNNNNEVTSMDIGNEGRISKDDIFMFNDNFESKHYRIKIASTSTSKKETVEEAKRTAEIIHEDRKPEIEAAIVRVLKAKRKVEHNALIAEVAVALRSRFKVDVGETKRRIERLIELEYVARDDKDRKIYRYLC